ncbi:putative inner membrane transporter YhbE [Escherichia coli]|nr:putative inner membrane transporter YhbE [Escherichia coli]
MKQQAGIGILLALTTAICWGALPIAMKQVLEVMEPPTIVFYRFLMASIGLGAILAVKKRLPPLRVFRKPRWLILLAVATAGLHPVQLILAIPESDRFAGNWATLASWHDGCQRIYPERENAQYSGCRGIDAPERPGDVF